MAEILEINQMLANSFEPKRKFRWYLQIDGLDAYTLKTAQRPQMTFEETVIDWVNTKRYISGKGTPNPITITLNDPLSPSASQKVMDWIRLNYEMSTGRMGYANNYKKDFTLKLLDPQGAVAELWDIKGGWVQDSNFGDLDMASSDLVEITATIRFDTFELQF